MPELRLPVSEMRQLVYVLANNPTEADAAGQPVDAWKRIKRFYVKIETPEGSGAKKLVGPQVIAEATHLVTLPYWAGLATQQRLQYGKRLFEITSVTDVLERKVMIVAGVGEVKDAPA